MMTRLLTISIPVLLFCSPISAQDKKPKVELKKNIVYGKGGKVDLQLDLAQPKIGKGPFPAVICVHGGGWKAGNRQSLTKLIGLLAEKGFVGVTVTYRLTPKAKFPAQIEDCKAAVRWLRAHAKKYKVDPNRLGAVGFSAGGHLVCLLGAADKNSGLEGNGGYTDQSSRVQAVVSFFGPTDFIKKTWSKKVEEFFLIPFFGDTFEKAQKIYRKGSPLNYVSKDDPPFLFIHGDQDNLVGIHHSQIMMKKLKEAKVHAELMTMKGAGHGWGPARMKQSLARMVTFLEEKLKK